MINCTHGKVSGDIVAVDKVSGHRFDSMLDKKLGWNNYCSRPSLSAKLLIGDSWPTKGAFRLSSKWRDPHPSLTKKVLNKAIKKKSL